MPAAQRVVSDSNPRARTVEPAVPAYVSDVLQLGLRLKVMERIQTVPQLYQALSSKEYTAELTRTMKPETPMHPVRAEQSAQGREHLLSLKGLLAGILILLSVLILLTLWGIVSSKEEQTPSSEPSSEAASSEEMKPQNLVPNFVGIDYEQIKNNREYTSMYLFRAVLEYSDTVPSGQVIRQEPEAGEVMENGEVIQIVVSQGPEKVEMPKIIGASQDKAIEILSSRGLVASCFMVVNDGSYATGCVVSASEEEGAMVTVGHGDHRVYCCRPQCADHCHPGRACRYRAYHPGNASGGQHRAGIRYQLNRIQQKQKREPCNGLPLLLV